MQAHELKKVLLHNGFKYLKVELEANVNPDGFDEPCGYCDEGSINCDCEGTESDCCYCCGEGSYSCSECDGSGYHSTPSSTYFADFELSFKRQLEEIKPDFKYLKCYHDGSVDTECTFTLRVDYIQDLPVIVEAFKKTCLEFGGCSTNKAGIHITLLPGYKYPRGKKLPLRKIENYKRHTSKLLLGLVYLGSNGDVTRGFFYRDFRISASDKYSAICTHNDTCLEFRFLDTCYSKPDNIIKYLSLIAKTLRYYTVDSKKVVGLGNSCDDYEFSRLVKKHSGGKYVPLTEVYESRESRKRLFAELQYLLNEQGRRVLSDIASLNPCQMSPEMFTVIKNYQ